MAKRPTRSQVNDTAAGTAEPKAARRGIKQLGPESVAGLEQAEPRSDPQPLPTNAMSMSSEPTEEEIRMRAYQMYLERGGDHGGDFDDWVRAEQELKKNRR